MNTIAIQMNANTDMPLDLNRSMNPTPAKRAGHLATLGLSLLLAGLSGSAMAAGNAPYKPGPGAPIFTQGDPAYKGISNAQSNVSANAPAGAAANLTSMVNQPPTISWVTSSNTVVTAPASFALSVNAADPDGSISKVEYYNGGTLIGSSTSAPFGFTWSNVAAGQYTLTAIATDNLGMSTTASAITVIANAPPSVSLNPPAGPLYSPASITLTANASDSDGSISKVEYYNGSTLIGSSTSSPYSISWTSVPVGNYSLTAIATDNYGASTTSSAVAVSVILTPSSTALNATSPVTVGQATTLTASVTGAVPTGTVTFKDGANTIGTGALNNGTTTLSYTFTTAGAHSITASYSGDANNTTSTSAATSETVNAAATTTALTATPSPATAGQAVTLTATVTGYNPSGTVTFLDGTTTLGTGTLNNGTTTLSYTFTTAGAHSITASYGGDVNNTSSTSAATSETVNPVVSTTSLSVTPIPAKVGQAITLSASVNGYNPSGNVTFLDGTTTLGSAPLNAGTASFSISFTGAGNHSLSAVYAGDSSNAGSVSAQVSLTLSSGVAQAYYIHTDQLDTPRQITDTQGNILWQWDNTDPFGNNIPNENPSGLGRFEFNKRFTGQYFDKETGLHYNVNRDYDPANGGRYIESDPIGLAGGINTYTYVGGNPLSRIDPAGTEFYMYGYGPAASIISAGYGIYKMMDYGVDAVKFKWEIEIAQGQTDVYNAAMQACQSYPQGGACNDLERLKKRADQCMANVLHSGSNLVPKN